MEKTGKNSIKDFIEAISRPDGDDESSLEITLPDFIDSIRVMTFHKAKGLGFPVVINVLRKRSGGRGGGFYFERRGNKLVAHSILKNFLGKGAERIDSIHHSKTLDDEIQDMNLLYVANTRTKDELYNIVLAPGKADGWSKLFEETQCGRPVGRRERKKRLPPTGIKLPSTVEKELGPGWDGGPWDERRLIEARRGEFLHRVLAGIEFLDGDMAGRIRRLVEDAVSSGMECADPESAVRAITSFVTSEALRPWFEKRPERKAHRELEYVDEKGRSWRLDRVVVDAQQAAVLDFKSSAREEDVESHKDQVRKYVEMMRRVYPEKEVSGLIAYIDSGNVKEVR